MQRIVVVLEPAVKARIRRLRRQTGEARVVLRCQIVFLAAKGWASREMAGSLGCSRSWASRVIQQFVEQGEAALADRREDNGVLKVDEHYLSTLHEVVSRRPTDYGFRRPTWTRELLNQVLARLTGVTVHAGTLSRALRQIGARSAAADPTVACPWSKAARNRRLAGLAALASVPADEVVVYADEVDIHLNPKIGLDWMNRGQPKEVLTPGKNQKRYLAGALNPAGGRLTGVESDRKNSDLVVARLRALAEDYRSVRRIHVILDHYRIHDSRITQRALAAYEGRIGFHFLPPYCPNDNQIERQWQDLHAEVTRNHTHATMDSLMDDVWAFIQRRAARNVVRRVAA